MMTELLTVLTVLPAQVLCLLPLWNQRKYGVGKTLGWLGLMDLLLFPVAAFLLHRYLLLPNTVLFPLLLAFFGGWQRCLKCAVYKSLAVFFAVCSLLCITVMTRNPLARPLFRMLGREGMQCPT